MPNRYDENSKTPIPQDWASFDDSGQEKPTVPASGWAHFSESDESQHPQQTAATSDSNTLEIWEMTDEQIRYYTKQFAQLQPNLNGLIPGLQAKNFFEMSQLSRDNLCKIWELSDLNHDGSLSLPEFCIAMHLVVLKKNMIDIPDVLPPYLRNIALSGIFSVLQHQAQPQPTDMTDAPGRVREPAQPAPIYHHGVGSGGMLHVLRKASVSSQQSDAISLAESLISFVDQLPPGAIVSHPVAVRPLEQPFGESDTVALQYSTDDDASFVAPFEELTVGDRTAMVATRKAPPSPPPRYPSLKESSPEAAFAYKAKTDNEEDENVKNELMAVKQRCDDLLRENVALSKKLIEMQEKRIYLEIVLENSLPLGAI